MKIIRQLDAIYNACRCTAELVGLISMFLFICLFVSFGFMVYCYIVCMCVCVCVCVCVPIQTDTWGQFCVLTA